MKRKIFSAITATAVFTLIAGLISCGDSDSNDNNDGGSMDELDRLYLEFLEDGYFPDGMLVNNNGNSEPIDFPLNGGQTFVGYGINLFQGPTFSKAIIGTPHLDTTKYTSAYIDNSRFNEVVQTTTVSEDLSDVYSSFSIDAKVGTGKSVPFLSANVSASYSSSNQIKSQRKFYKYDYSKVIQKHTLNLIDYDYADLFKPRSFTLTDKYADNILKASTDAAKAEAAKDLFETIGSHIITVSGNGGFATITALYNSDEAKTDADIKAALDFSSAWVSGSVSTEIKNKYESMKSSLNIKVNYSGGDGTADIVGTTLDALAPQLKAWGESIENGQTISYIYKLLPIWELASTTARKNAIMNAFIKKAENEQAYLNGLFPRGEIPVPPTEEFIQNNGIYFIRSDGASGLLSIDVVGQSQSDGAYLHLWESGSQKSQQWQAIKLNNGDYRFKNVNSGKYMDAVGYNTYMQQKTIIDNSKGSQEWMLMSVDKNKKTAELSCNRTGGAITYESGTITNGTRIFLGTDGKRWKFVPVN